LAISPGNNGEETMADKMMDGNVAPAQIDIWRAKYGAVHQIAVPIDDDGVNKVYGYFRKPDLMILSACAKFSDIDPVKSGTIMFDACFLGGDEQFKTNDEVKMSSILALNRLFKIRLAELKNV
jgi:hypothetical protein